MRQSWLIILALALVACIGACSTSNVGTVPAPDDSARSASFTVSTEEGLGSFTPRLEVEEAQGQAIVRVYAEDAVDLQAAYVNLGYDATAYSPNRVEFSEFIGGADDVLTLAITNMRDVVPIGAAQIAGRMSPVSGDGLLATVHFSQRPFLAARAASCPPSNAINSVDDLKIIDQNAGEVTLSWTEKNKGDYDNNGEVSISDLTPIALLYGQLVATSPDPVWAGLVDGDGNGEINSADITPIGVNFGNNVDGYSVFADEGGTQLIPESDPCTCERSNFLFSNKVPVKYVYVAASEGTSFTVRPVDIHDTGTLGILSNTAVIVNVPGPPDAPTNLAANTGEQVGAMAIQLGWTASTHADVSAYEIERKLTSEGDGAWAKIQQVGAATLGYTDSGLANDSYDYRVRAKDLTELFSDYSNVESATPWSPPPPSPPTNLTSTNEIATGNAIQLNWDAPGDGTAIKFNVYCKGPLEPDFSVISTTPNSSIKTYLHTGLTEFETYEYRVTSIGIGSVESVPSNTTSNTPSGAAEITIESLTTDKTTHCNDASEPASNLVVTCNIAPDSVDWDPTLGTITGTGTSVQYKPTNGQAAGKVVVTCTVHKGPVQDSRTIDLYVTTEGIMTEYGDNGHYIEGAPTLLSGGGICPTLETLESGGARVEDRTMSYYMTREHVTYFSTFDIS